MGVLAAGCGVASKVGFGRSDATGAWLARDTTSTDLLQLTESKDGVLNGSLTDAQAAPEDRANPIKTTNLTVTGVRHGSSISLTVNAGLGISAPLTGTFKAAKITLQVPSTNGNIEQGTFKPSSPDRYNTAVNQLRQGVVAQQSTAAEAQQQEAAAAARSKAQTDLVNAVAALDKDLPRLDERQKLQPKLAAVQTELAKTQSDAA